MPVLDWHDGLNVGVGFMDRDHDDAARLINQLADCAGDARIATFKHFIDHCRDHFGREEALMEKVGFFAMGCHKGEHQRVLAEFDAVLAKLQAGDGQDAYFADQLPQWLMLHRNTMDFVTADFALKAGCAPD